jgi:hypothetical protein
MQDTTNKLVYGEPFSKDKFAAPSKEFGIMPFWFVNGEMDYAEMEHQLGEFASKGIPGIHFHARFGIKDHMPYLSEEWMKRYNFAAEKCRELGMQLWVYDEYNWPSGTCNQEIMAERPELTSRYLEVIVNDIPGQFFTFVEGTDSRYNDLEQSEPVYACALLEEDVRAGRFAPVNLLPNLAFDKVVAWEAPKGPWKLCYFIERKASWYIDAFDERSTQEFLRKVYQNYKDHVPDFQRNVRGFFTDEPAMHYFESPKDNFIVPWSGKMLKIFRDINGYDLKPHLPQLYFDIGDYHRVRHDFWSALSKQYEKAYYRQIRDWCEENGVVFTGHLLFEEWLRRQAKVSGNLFHMLKNLHMTGIDHLYPRIGTREMPDEHVAIKIASSAAHQFGSQRLICESMGGSYWDCTMERMKWIADWEYALGVNIFTPHGFHYSIEGERKRDWPPSQFYHHPWWKYYGLFNDYIKRVGYLMTGGVHVARAAVLYPINHIWANFVPQGADACSKLCVDDFNFMTDALLRLHCDFDYVDEDMLRKMEIADGKIRVRGEEYSLLILPPVTHIKEHTWKLIRQFADGGGKLVFDALLPVEFLEAAGEADIADVQKLTGLDGNAVREAVLKSARADNEVHTIKSANGANVTVILGPGLAQTKDIETLRKIVDALVTRDVDIDNDEMFCLHRVKDGVPFYFVVNPTDGAFDAKITLRRKGAPVEYGLLDGSIRRVLDYESSTQAVTFVRHFPPYGSAMFCMEEINAPHTENADFTVTAVTGDAVAGYGAGANASAAYVNGCVKKKISAKLPAPPAPLPLGDTWKFQARGENALVLMGWKFALADSSNRDFFKEKFDASDWLDYTMGGWELQLPWERDEQIYPVDALYRAEFTADFLPDDLKLFIDGFKCSEYGLYINGKKVSEKGERSWLDSQIRQINIRKYAKTGRNGIAIRMRVHGKTHGLLDYLKITGTFSLAGEKPYVIAPPKTALKTGTWTRQGYPTFSGTGVLTQTVRVPETYVRDKVLKLRVSCGKDVAEVAVNGQKAGVCLWAPYEVDITGLLQPGANEISIAVTNTLINLLEAVEQDSGVFGAEIAAYNQFTIKV